MLLKVRSEVRVLKAFFGEKLRRHKGLSVEGNHLKGEKVWVVKILEEKRLSGEKRLRGFSTTKDEVVKK
jgi:hypothetical protein